MFSQIDLNEQGFITLDEFAFFLDACFEGNHNGFDKANQIFRILQIKNLRIEHLAVVTFRLTKRDFKDLLRKF